MADLTITVGDETLRRARDRATREGRSLDAVLRDYLEAYSQRAADQRRALEDVIRLAASVDTSAGARRWNRDEIHDRG